MADESVWIDLDEVQSSAKTILRLLKELEGPANQLEAAVKQVQDSVYGADLLGKSLQGSGSSIGGLGQHQEQVMAGIRVLMQNATAMGDNLAIMAARHEANDQQHAAELARIGESGTVAAVPGLAGLPSGGQVHAASVSGRTLSQAEDTTLQPLTAQTVHPASIGEPRPDHLVRPDAPMRPLLLPDDVRPVTPPAPIAPVDVPDAGVAYHDPDAPELHYNDYPNPLFV
ncbi:hypothetical protein [Kitasatospora sp. NPDC057223]|uniref:hypothetical protein n=1 Tax=Kitasatospora sp. NPDC057223 TaxID=3346055 RepID=UPI0036310F30